MFIGNCSLDQDDIVSNFKLRFLKDKLWLHPLLLAQSKLEMKQGTRHLRFGLHTFRFGKQRGLWLWVWCMSSVVPCRVCIEFRLHTNSNNNPQTEERGNRQRTDNWVFRFLHISASIHIKEDYLIPCEEMSLPILEVRNIVISESEITEPEKIEQQTWWGESEGGWESTDGRPLLVSQRGSEGGGGQLGSSPGRRHRDVILSSFYPYRQRPEAEIHI